VFSGVSSTFSAPDGPFSELLDLSVFLSPCFAKKKPPAAPINLNTSASEELQQMPGIGPVTTEKILQMRKSYGAFKSVNDLPAVGGIGPKRLEKMRKYLTVSKAGVATKPVNAPRPVTPSKPPAVPSDPPDPPR
jgi:competence ComEA-like helix-hairpin-helix protein